jgi:hypothetical protein
MAAGYQPMTKQRPGGPTDNSPAFKPRVRCNGRNSVPLGTAEIARKGCGSFQSGLRDEFERRGLPATEVAGYFHRSSGTFVAAEC